MNRQPLTRFLLAGACFVIVVAGMRAASDILVPLILSAFIATVCAPPLFWLKRKGLPTPLAIFIVIAAIIFIGLGVGALVSTSLDRFIHDLPLYQENLRALLGGSFEWFSIIGVEVGGGGVMKAFDPGDAMKLVSGLLTGLSSALTNGFLISFTVIFILLEASTFQTKLRSALADPERSIPYFEKFINNVQQYIAIKTWMSLLTAGVIVIWLFIIGVDYPLLWGLLAFLLNYVPNIGSIIAAVPTVLLALLQLGPGSAVLTAIGYLAVNMVIGNLLEPKVMGRGLGLSTLVVFLSLVFWGWVFGSIGMLLSVPLTMTIKIALDSGEKTQWMAVLLGSEAHPKELD
ncbi:MAG: AI-2E family transporter [Proteobacteria bacterium]|nr:AI-2E family transporter [Pseudomonadota bacterium]